MVIEQRKFEPRTHGINNCRAIELLIRLFHASIFMNLYGKISSNLPLCGTYCVVCNI